MADILRPKRIAQKEKNLVAEQSGMTKVAAGLLIAFVVGFSIRGLIHPQKIQNLVLQASKQIHKEISVSFDSAEVSLSDGFWPRFSLVIKKIQMKSDNACWMRPQLEVDEIELPLSVSEYFTSGSPFTTILANDVHLIILAEKRDCLKVTIDQSQEIKPVQAVQAVTLVQKEEKKNTVKPSLDRVIINRLEIDPVYFPLAHTELKDVELFVKSHQPEIISLKAHSNIFKDNQWGDYAAHAQISVDYTEFPEKKIEAHVFGNWREGSYSWNTSYRMDEGFFQTETDLRHIPISKLASLSKKWGFERFESMKQVWLSLKAKSSGTIGTAPKSPLTIQDLKIEGDTGELIVDKLEWLHMDDPSPQPFLAQIRALSLQTLLKTSPQTQSSPLLNDLGFFTGRAEVENINNMKILGELHGFQFVFSNKGQREYQTIKQMSLDLKRSQGKWALNISRLEPDQGVFNGEISAVADSQLQDIKVKLIAEEFSFSPSVQKLMAGGGSLGTFQSRIDFGFHEGVLNSLQGKLSGKNLDVEHIKMPQVQMQFMTDKDDGFGATLQIPELTLGAKIVEHSFLNQISDVLPLVNNQLEVKQFRTRFKLKNFQDLKWKQLSFNFIKGSASGFGEWNTQGQLSGQINFKFPTGTQKYIFEGTRDLPIVRKSND